MRSLPEDYAETFGGFVEELMTQYTEMVLELFEYFITGEALTDFFGIPSPDAEPEPMYFVAYACALLSALVIVGVLDWYFDTHPVETDDGEGDLR